MKTRTNPSTIQAAVCEAVEARQMFAATAVLDAAGLLTITGTSNADVIEVNKSASDLKVKLNGTTKTFKYDKVKKIEAALGDKADKYKSNDDVVIPMKIEAGSGNDTVIGGGFRDSIYGGDGNDSIIGNAMQDQVWAGKGNDTVHGNGGNDFMYDEPGYDQYYGDDDDDVFLTGIPSSPETEGDMFDGGAGAEDAIDYYGRKHAVRVYLDGKSNDGCVMPGETESHEKDNIRANVEIVVGTALSDGIFAYGDVDNIVSARGGNDTVVGDGGDDLLMGDEGRDLLIGDSGEDTLEGGVGRDTLYGGNNNDWLYGGFDADELHGENGSDHLAADDGNLWEIVDGGAGNDYGTTDMLAFWTPGDVVTSIENDWV